ncbi:MAG TPA: cupin domain-containing protein [Dehalococcoidia bacterium]|nr:cupin domain-containing protein [Dehalococcoidia bacterium]
MFRANAEAQAVEMFPGVVRRTLNSGDRTTLVEITLAKGSSVPVHTHPHEQIGYVVSGRVLFRIGDGSRELAAGDSYCVPGGEEHGVDALEDAICIDIFSPVRDEYL